MFILSIAWKIISGGLAKYWKIIVPILLLLFAYLYVTHLQHEAAKYKTLYDQDVVTIKGWSDKFTQLKGDYDDAVTQCKKTIDAQNAQVETVAKQAEKFKQAASVAKQQSNALRDQYEQKIKNILAEPKPKTCDDSMKYLIDHAKTLGPWEEPKHE